MVDMAVVETAYKTAVSLGASDKVMLALFEAGLVESNFTNPTVATDHDSLGFLQQRPSQGWGTPSQVTNVAYATTTFVNKATPIQNRYVTAGQLAQAVQRSAFPLRYDQRQAQAQQLINQMKLKIGGNVSTVGIGGSLGDAVSTAQKLFSMLTDPLTYRRLMWFGVGGFLITYGIFLVSKDKVDSLVGAAQSVVASGVELVATKGKKVA